MSPSGAARALALRAHQRMPAGFGPAPGPRNVPDDEPLPDGPERRTTLRFEVEADVDEIARVLPAPLKPDAPTMTVQAQRLDNLRWLAGRGYDIVSVSFPVRWHAADGDRVGDYLAVLWESMPEPIITGRDELGFPKLFATIDAPELAGEVDEIGRDETTRVTASWDGVPFFTASADELVDVAATTAPPPRPVLTRRYLPTTGRLASAVVDELTITGPPTRLDLTVLRSAAGVGEMSFRPMTWEQNPTQYLVINKLAAMTAATRAAVRLQCVEGQFSAVGNQRFADA